ncbi:hypothetical protein Tco_1405940 [Tanacetum coccineum]
MVAYLQKSEGSEGFYQIIDFLTTSHIKHALTESPTIYVSLIEHFWQTASASTLENGDMEITATIDGKVKVVSEPSIRRHLKLEDSNGISTLPTSKIFEQLALMVSNSDNLTFQKGHFFPQVRFYRVNDQQSQLSPITHPPISAPSTSQPPTSPPSMQTTHVTEKAANMPHDSHLPGDLKQTKKVYGNAYTKLIMKVKKLKYKVKSSKARRRAKIVTSDDEDNQEDPSKQGRKIAQIDEDKGITLIQMRAQTQGRHEHDFENLILISTAGAEVSTASSEVRTAAAES